MADDTGGFLSRWSRRKEQVRSGGGVDVAGAVVTAPEPVASVPAAAVVLEAAPVQAAPAGAAPADTAVAVAAAPPPTLADVALLTHDSDDARFIVPGIDEGVKRAALKKLFTDPHFNIMDGLDTYIDDYGKPDPIPLSMLRQMNQSKFLRLFDDEEDDDAGAKEAEPNDAATAAAARLPDPTMPPDDDPDLRLQQDDEARRSGPRQGPRA